MKSDFYISHNKFQDLSNKALDWYLKSGKFQYNSNEWKICRLKQDIYNQEAMKYLKKAVKEINGQL